MKILHLKLKQGVNKIQLQQTTLKTTNQNNVKIQNCFVKWSLQNINIHNNSFFLDSNLTTIPIGYYSFQDIKKYLSSHKIIIEKNLNNTITLTSEKDLNLSSFGLFLGFSKNKTITKSTSYTSSSPADFTNGLQQIDIYSDLIDPSLNFENGKYSTLLTSLPIDTSQPLNGTITSYNLKSKIPTRNSDNREINFTVFSHAQKSDYEIFLSLEINV